VSPVTTRARVEGLRGARDACSTERSRRHRASHHERRARIPLPPRCRPRDPGPPRARSVSRAMGSVSSKSKKKKDASKALRRVTEVDRQVLGLKTQRRKLTAYASRVSAQIREETVKAKALAKQGDKPKCLHALRRRKLHERNADKIDGWLLSVEELLNSIEQAQATAVVLERLKQGNEALRQAQAGYGVEDVREILREMENHSSAESEINELLGRRLDRDAEDAALAELAELTSAASAEGPLESRETEEGAASGTVLGREGGRIEIEHEHERSGGLETGWSLPDVPVSERAARNPKEAPENPPSREARVRVPAS